MTDNPRAGTRLGHCEVVAPLGAGGLGGLRTTPSGGRFEREARMISLLNHPHICTLFDWSQAFSDVLVMDMIGQ